MWHAPSSSMLRRLQRLRRIPWPEVVAGLLAPFAGMWLGQQLTSANWTAWFTFIGVAFHVVLVLAAPLAGLLFYAITAPFARFVHLDVDLGGGIPDLGLNRVVAGTLFVVLLAQLALRRRRWQYGSALDVTFVLFLGALLLSAANAVYGVINAVQTTFDAYVIPFLFFFAARHLVHNEDSLRWVIGAFLIIGLYLTFLTVREQLTGEVLFDIGYAYPMYSPHIRKVVGLLGSPTFMGMALAIIAPTSLYALLRAHSLAARSLIALVFGAVLVGIFMTYSRAAWLGTLLALTVMGLLDRPARRLLIPLVLIATATAVIFWDKVITSYAVTERLMAEASVDFRITATQIATRIIQESPLLGIGFNSFGAVAQYRWGWTPFIIPGTFAATHNTFLFVLTSAGLLGFLPYLAFCLLLAYAFWRNYRRAQAQRGPHDPGLPALGLAVYVAYLAPSLTVDMAFGFFVNTLFFIIMGAMLGAQLDLETRTAPL